MFFRQFEVLCHAYIEMLQGRQANEVLWALVCQPYFHAYIEVLQGGQAAEVL
jgi:hypothetical protein